MSVSCIYLIPEDVLPEDSKAIGIIPIPSYTHPRKKNFLEDDDDDDDDGEELAWGREQTRTFFVLLKQTV